MSFSDILSDKKKRVALTSILAALFLTIIKLAVGLHTNSLGILAEALHSGLDMLAAIITFFAVYFSGRESDLDHHFGHGKVENFSALIETVLLIITCGWIIIEAFERMLHPVTPDVNILSFGVIIIAIIIDYERSRMLFKVAKETRSQALQADALHFSTDILSSFVVIAGLVFVTIGFPIGDAIAGIVVAIIVAWISIQLGLSTINALMDKVPLQEYNLVKDYFEKEFPEYKIKQLRLRESGPDIIGDLTILMPITTNLNDFHSTRDLIHSRIQKIVPNIELLITAYPKDDPTSDKVSSNFIQNVISNVTIDGLTDYETHNVTYYTSEGSKSLDIHLQLPNELTLNKAHEYAEQFKEKIHQKIPILTSINIHLEPLQRIKTNQFEAQNSKNMSSKIDNEIRSLLKDVSQIKTINKIEVSIHKSRYIILVSVKLDGNLNLVDAHSITEIIESKLYLSIKNIDKILVHTQPN